MLTAKDIKVGQRWRSKYAPKKTAKIGAKDDVSVQLQHEPGGFWYWETNEILLADWELVDVAT